jgi:hypothetical protein
MSDRFVRRPAALMIRALLLIAFFQTPASTRQSGAGTYDVLLCSEPCIRADSANALAKGVVVLNSVPIRFAHDLFNPNPNGCFRFSRSPKLQSYAVLMNAGYTGWRLSGGGDSITFDTYRSPDAGHDIQAILTDTGFRGVGHSWGAGVAEIYEPDEYVIAYRTGPPHLNKCPFVREDRRSAWLSPLVFGAASVVTLLLILHSAR